jgi:pimeloyl-ACP methyl ester carboxylesterase
VAGTALLLLHAFPFDARMWDDVRPPFEERGWAVLAPSLPLKPSRRTMAEWAEDVLGLTDEPVIPVGVSMGGYLAFELWRRAPGRIPALILCDTRAASEPPEGKAVRDRTIDEIGAGGAEAVWRSLEDRLLAGAASREVRDRARRLALDQDPESLIAAVEAIRDRPDSTETVATIVVPALVVVGEEDAIVPQADAAVLATALPNGRLRVLPGAGHVPPLERADALVAVVAGFLEEVVA